ncbi:ADP-ribosylglycohydrolase family protein [Sphingobium fuliginis]|uniref:Hydrolase, putative n=1 Tax=Sphingobium fuliginis (strain ATCC 27551) TaxID=336203 RepID=A0A292ZAX8_SPHSA|nr:ADP-ribosylglycohydrolase family protein [Sphingobium fuliginis]GAY20106.1 hydrolase, putative [Sphingobium fuliginis]
MIGAIAGDIAGSRFEGSSPFHRDFDLFHPHCRFTDDTVCSLAVADAVLSGTGFSQALRAFVRRHPNRGYGAMFRTWAFEDDAPGYGSWGNGAPMRVAAIGWLAENPGEVDWLAERQACVTHNHPDAVKAAQAVAQAIFSLRNGMPIASVRTEIQERFGYDFRSEIALRPRGFDVSAAGTVPTALAAAFEAESWEEAVRSVILLGGDTDTLACIAGGVAEAIHGVPDTMAVEARRYLTADLLDVLDRFDEHLRSRAAG